MESLIVLFLFGCTLIFLIYRNAFLELMFNFYPYEGCMEAQCLDSTFSPLYIYIYDPLNLGIKINWFPLFLT